MGRKGSTSVPTIWVICKTRRKFMENLKEMTGRQKAESTPNKRQKAGRRKPLLTTGQVSSSYSIPINFYKTIKYLLQAKLEFLKADCLQLSKNLLGLHIPIALSTPNRLNRKTRSIPKNHTVTQNTKKSKKNVSTRWSYTLNLNTIIGSCVTGKK